MLFYDTEAALLSPGDFLLFCSAWIPVKEFNLLKNASIQDVRGDETSNPVVTRWNLWERTLRNELVSLRAQQKKTDLFEDIVPGEKVLGLANIAREAFSQPSPLTGEDMLNRSRWNFLEELETGHHFDIEKLIIYYLKLQLLQRKDFFNKERGRANYNEIFAYITADSNGS